MLYVLIFSIVMNTLFIIENYRYTRRMEKYFMDRLDDIGTGISNRFNDHDIHLSQIFQKEREAEKKVRLLIQKLKQLFPHIDIN